MQKKKEEEVRKKEEEIKEAIRKQNAERTFAK